MTYYAHYCNFMSDIISKGYARKVYDEFKDHDGRTWYLVPAASRDLPPAKVESTSGVRLFGHIQRTLVE